MRVVWLSLFLVACAAPHSSPPERTDRNEKPQAAVTVTIADRDLGNGDHEVTLTATPTREVADLELRLDGERQAVGHAAAGEAHTLSARVHVEAGKGRDVVGTALTGGRSKAALVHVGAATAEAPQRTTVVTDTDGVELEEVRP